MRRMNFPFSLHWYPIGTEEKRREMKKKKTLSLFFSSLIHSIKNEIESSIKKSFIKTATSVDIYLSTTFLSRSVTVSIYKLWA
jgi:hypothetical protein